MSDATSTTLSTSTPPPRAPRTLVLCFDGTTEDYSANNSNVVRFLGLLKKDCDSQMVYYQAGVGTYFQPGVVSPLLTRLAKLVDDAVAWYLDVHVMQGYTYIMNTYQEGDKICLFGFSRGAYTARAVAGMLSKVGLLPPKNTEQVKFAYKLYKRTDKQGVLLAEGYKKTFSRDVGVEFVGVWDTVQSTGIIMNRSLPFTDCNNSIKTFRHALSLDEHRAKFRPNLFHHPAPNNKNASLDPEHASSANPSPGGDAQRLKPPKASFLFRAFRRGGGGGGGGGTRRDGGGRAGGRQSIGMDVEKDGSVGGVGGGKGVDEVDVKVKVKLEMQCPGTDVREVWFAGCHGDVGGGCVTNSITTCLSQIPLRWMVEQVVLSGCGIQFDEGALPTIGLPRATPTSTLTPLSTAAAAAGGGGGGACRPRLPGTNAECDDPTSRVDSGSSVLGREGCELPLWGSVGGDAFSLAATELAHLEIVEGTGAEICKGRGGKGVSASKGAASSSKGAVSCALAPIHDQLAGNWMWWLLEVVPLDFAWQDGRGVWHRRWSFNLGKGRYVPRAHPLFHISVRERMEDGRLGYRPRARFLCGSEVYVGA